MNILKKIIILSLIGSMSGCAICTKGCKNYKDDYKRSEDEYRRSKYSTKSERINEELYKQVIGENEKVLQRVGHKK